jgi:hypothetical protein
MLIFIIITNINSYFLIMFFLLNILCLINYYIFSLFLWYLIIKQSIKAVMILMSKPIIIKIYYYRFWPIFAYCFFFFFLVYVLVYVLISFNNIIATFFNLMIHALNDNSYTSVQIEIKVNNIYTLIEHLVRAFGIKNKKLLIF